MEGAKCIFEEKGESWRGDWTPWWTENVQLIKVLITAKASVCFLKVVLLSAGSSMQKRSACVTDIH